MPPTNLIRLDLYYSQQKTLMFDQRIVRFRPRVIFRHETNTESSHVVHGAFAQIPLQHTHNNVYTYFLLCCIILTSSSIIFKTCESRMTTKNLSYLSLSAYSLLLFLVTSHSCFVCTDDGPRRKAELHNLHKLFPGKKLGKCSQYHPARKSEFVLKCPVGYNGCISTFVGEENTSMNTILYLYC